MGTVEGPRLTGQVKPVETIGLLGKLRAESFSALSWKGGFHPHIQPVFYQLFESFPPKQDSVRAINTKEPTPLYLQHAGCLYK